MPDPKPPRSVKENQHYVPRMWLSRFAGQDGRVSAIENGILKHQVSVADIMSGDWIYTVFDEWWRPSDSLEDALANVEAEANTLFDMLQTSPDLPTDEQWVALCKFLALTACRHPETMRRGHLRSKTMAWALADVRAYPDKESFLQDFKKRFGSDLPPAIYDAYMKESPEALLEQAEIVEHLSPQDPQLPEQLSVEAVTLVANTIVLQDLYLVDAPPGSDFVFSDHPLPLSELRRGFSVPLSRTLAFEAVPRANGPFVLRRITASPEMINRVNREQAIRARTTLIGPDKTLLETVWKDAANQRLQR